MILEIIERKKEVAEPLAFPFEPMRDELAGKSSGGAEGEILFTFSFRQLFSDSIPVWIYF